MRRRLAQQRMTLNGRFTSLASRAVSSATQLPGRSRAVGLPMKSYVFSCVVCECCGGIIVDYEYITHSVGNIWLALMNTFPFPTISAHSIYLVTLTHYCSVKQINSFNQVPLFNCSCCIRSSVRSKLRVFGVKTVSTLHHQCKPLYNASCAHLHGILIALLV